VVEIPKSPNAPHAVGGVDTGWKFPRRTNRGAENMNIPEIRTGFLNFYEKRLKLELLAAELHVIRSTASMAAVTDPSRIESEIGLAPFDLQVLETVLADTYSVTATEHELHRALRTIRQNARFCNAKQQVILGVIHMPLSNRGALLREHNQTIRNISETLKQSCDSAIQALDALLSRQ